MSLNTRNILVEIAAERTRAKLLGRELDVPALVKLAQWHEDQARYPGDVAGSDRNRYQRARFHANAALDIREALSELKVTDGLASEPTVCTYPRCKCIVSTSSTKPIPTCPKGLPQEDR